LWNEKSNRVMVPKMNVKIADIIKVMEGFAPSRLAEEWDNVGLQIGQKEWPVRNIWVALDPLPEVVGAACENNVDLLITHHPLIFQPLKSIDINTPVGSAIQTAIRNQLSIFVAHTNLDSVKDGVNDLLAARIGLKNLKVLGRAFEPESCKLVVYVPVEYEKKVLDALFETEAGKIGSYTCCSFRNEGKGTFRPGISAKPVYGKIGEISHTNEVRIETIVYRDNLQSVIEQLRESHPYETMAYDVYPLSMSENGQGLGRIGELDNDTELYSLALMVKKKLGIESVKVSGRYELPVNKVAICSGSGSGLIRDFLSSAAQVYISGDLRYHDARAVEAANLGLIDIGHFASEHLIVEGLAKRLLEIFSENGIDVKVEACGLEKDPFMIL